MNTLLKEMFSQIFKRKHYGLKAKFRFLNDDEIIDQADHQFAVLGHGIFKFKNQDHLEGYLETRQKESLGISWESKVLSYLAKHPEEFAIGYKMILVARLLDCPDDVAVWPTSVPGDKVGEYDQRVFIRKL